MRALCLALDWTYAALEQRDQVRHLRHQGPMLPFDAGQRISGQSVEPIHGVHAASVAPDASGVYGNDLQSR